MKRIADTQKINCEIKGVLTWICIQSILTDHPCTHRRTYNLGPRFPLDCRPCSGRYTDLKITKQTRINSVDKFLGIRKNTHWTMWYKWVGKWKPCKTPISDVVQLMANRIQIYWCLCTFMQLSQVYCLLRKHFIRILANCNPRNYHQAFKFEVNWAYYWFCLTDLKKSINFFTHTFVLGIYPLYHFNRNEHNKYDSLVTWGICAELIGYPCPGKTLTGAGVVIWMLVLGGSMVEPGGFPGAGVGFSWGIGLYVP